MSFGKILFTSLLSFITDIAPHMLSYISFSSLISATYVHPTFLPPGEKLSHPKNHHHHYPPSIISHLSIIAAPIEMRIVVQLLVCLLVVLCYAMLCYVICLG